jgi:hypothetical protein
MPTCEVILEHANKTFFRFFTQFGTADMTKSKNISNLSRERNGRMHDVNT